MDQIREDQSILLKDKRYKVGDLLKDHRTSQSYYHDERKQIANSYDKYRKVKEVIRQIAEKFRIRGR